MDRRTFLLKSTAYLIGGYFGTSLFSKAFAHNLPTNQLGRPRIALIIDDIGFSFSRARWFLKLGIPITFAVLPRLPRTAELACEIQSQGHEIMLHQPMEPYNSDFDPGPGALYVGDGINKIIHIMEENISDVPFIRGVNNHMGSRFTSRRKEIEDTLNAVKDNDLFFVDSFTTSHSMAYQTARRLHIPAACRNIFLDNIQHESNIIRQLHKLKNHAHTFGHAVGIGHPFPETARVIRRFLKNFENSGIELVHVSEILQT
ncbi:divergent polysaccharide deacetylase family protein [Thermodesulfobacteriota bacterium]